MTAFRPLLLPIAWASALLLLAGAGPIAVKRALPAMLQSRLPLGGWQVQSGQVTMETPMRWRVQNLKVRRKGRELSIARVRLTLALWSQAGGFLQAKKIVAEGASGQLSWPGADLNLSDAYGVATAEEGRWKINLRGKLGTEGSQDSDVRLTASSQDGAHLQFTPPLNAPMPRLPRLRLRLSSATIEPGWRTGSLVGARVVDDQGADTFTAEQISLKKAGEVWQILISGLTGEMDLQTLSAWQPKPQTRRSPTEKPGKPKTWALKTEGARIRLHYEGEAFTLTEANAYRSPNGQWQLAAAIGSPYGRANTSLTMQRRGKEWAVQTKVNDLRIEHPGLTPRPVDMPALVASGSVRLAADAVRFALPHIAVGQAAFDGQLSLAGLASGKPIIDARFGIPKQRCQDLFDTVPTRTWRKLRKVRLEGEFEGALRVHVDMSAIKSSLTIEGEGALDQCLVSSLGPRVKLEALNKRYVHRWSKAVAGAAIKVGPGTDSYVRLSQIPASVRRAMVVTEDGRYWKHPGVSLRLIGKGLKRSLMGGRFVYGGSTITQQLVKNLFLDPHKDLARKLEEAVIAISMERVVSKERILELYINVIEFGPGIYGLDHAARFYFDKDPRELTPVEGAFLASIKPLPSAGPRLARQRRFKGWWKKRMIQVMTWLKDGGYISDQQFLDAAPYKPTFRGDVVSQARTLTLPTLEVQG